MEKMAVNNIYVTDGLHLDAVKKMQEFCDQDIYTLDLLKEEEKKLWYQIQEQRTNCFYKMISLLNIEDMDSVKELLLLAKNLYLYEQETKEQVSPYLSMIFSYEDPVHMGEAITYQIALSLLEEYLVINCTNYHSSIRQRKLFKTLKDNPAYIELQDQLAKLNEMSSFTYRNKIYTKTI